MTMIKKDGNWVTVAGGQRMWVGTQAQLDAALAAGELEDNVLVMVTDDYGESNTKVAYGQITAQSGFIPHDTQTSLIRCGNMVTLTVSGNTGYMNDAAGLSHSANNQDIIFNVPDGFKPAGVTRFAASCHTATVGDGIEPAIFSLETTGVCTAAGTNKEGQIDWIWGSVSYPTKDAWPTE